MMKKLTLLLILLLVKGVSFSQSLRTFNATPTFTQKSITPVMTQAAGDTLLWVTLPSIYVNPADSANFAIGVEDVDGLVPNSGSIQEPAWGVYLSTDPADIDPTQGDVDTAYFYAATSWFNPAPGTANNWITFGPIVLPAAGADLSWRLMVPDPAFRDGYEVLISTTGGTSADFTNPPVYSVADQDPSISPTWANYGVALDSTNYGGDTVWIAFHHNAVDMYILLLDNILLKEATTALPGNNDECAGATDINSAFGGTIGVEITMGPYDNDSATTGPQDPIAGFECFGEPDGTGTAPTLDNTLWFTFTGDGSIYFIETGNCAGVTNYIDDGDTQLALYSGTCGALTPVDCNEDGPSATSTTYPAGFTITTSPGTVYYMIVDGFNFNGALSTGQFCLKITKQAPVLCNDPSVTVGTETQNDTNICWMDTLIVSTTGALSSNVGSYFGIGWIISSASITGNTDPLNDPSVLGSYTFTSPAPAVSTRSFINDGTFAPVQPGATYYWTPVVFGNATAAAPPQFFGDLTLDPACTITGTSLAANMLVAGDPLCSVSVIENVPGKSSSLVAYPSPAKDVLTIEFMNTVSGKAIVNITDNVGRLVQSNTVGSVKGLNNTTVNVKSLAAGSYFVNVKTNDGSRTVKFIKN